MVYVRLSGPKGARLVRLALDTGATTTMVPPKAALAIGVNPVRATVTRETLTASGKELVPVVTIPALRLFERTFRRVAVVCHELPSESPIDGLLGLDLLTRLRAVVDLTKPSIRIP
mgnify:CR=1 FL=1